MDDRDVLFLARAKELQHEYENLVRSLDVAYEAVRQINTAMSENRSEARRIFQERLELLASRPNVRKQETADDNAATDKDYTRESTRNAGVTSTSCGATIHHNENSSCISNAIAPSLIYFSPAQKTINTTKGYVGDDHSYAGVDTNSIEQNVTPGGTDEQEQENYARCGATEVDVDLSIVKSEVNEESNDWETMHEYIVNNPLPSGDHSSSCTSESTMMAKSKMIRQESYILKKRYRRKNTSMLDDEALTRKRVMTRNRMRRWRARKRLEQCTTANKTK